MQICDIYNIRFLKKVQHKFLPLYDRKRDKREILPPLKSNLHFPFKRIQVSNCLSFFFSLSDILLKS